jgi:hypothetical protein
LAGRVRGAGRATDYECLEARSRHTV